MFGVFSCLLNKIDEWIMDGLNGGNFCGKGRILWKCSTPVLLWHFWNERNTSNSRMFEDMLTSLDSFWALVQNTTSWWCINYTIFFCTCSFFYFPFVLGISSN